MENLFLTKELELLLGEFGSAKDVRTFGEARTLFQGASEFQVRHSATVSYVVPQQSGFSLTSDRRPVVS